MSRPRTRRQLALQETEHAKRKAVASTSSSSISPVRKQVRMQNAPENEEEQHGTTSEDEPSVPNADQSSFAVDNIAPAQVHVMKQCMVQINILEASVLPDVTDGRVEEEEDEVSEGESMDIDEIRREDEEPVTEETPPAPRDMDATPRAEVPGPPQADTVASAESSRRTSSVDLDTSKADDPLRGINRKSTTTRNSKSKSSMGKGRLSKSRIVTALLTDLSNNNTSVLEQSIAEEPEEEGVEQPEENDVIPEELTPVANRAADTDPRTLTKDIVTDKAPDSRDVVLRQRDANVATPPVSATPESPNDHISPSPQRQETAVKKPRTTTSRAFKKVSTNNVTLDQENISTSGRAAGSHGVSPQKTTRTRAARNRQEETVQTAAPEPDVTENEPQRSTRTKSRQKDNSRSRNAVETEDVADIMEIPEPLTEQQDKSKRSTCTKTIRKNNSKASVAEVEAASIGTNEQQSPDEQEGAKRSTRTKVLRKGPSALLSDAGLGGGGDASRPASAVDRQPTPEKPVRNTRTRVIKKATTGNSDIVDIAEDEEAPAQTAPKGLTKPQSLLGSLVKMNRPNLVNATSGVTSFINRATPAKQISKEDRDKQRREDIQIRMKEKEESASTLAENKRQQHMDKLKKKREDGARREAERKEKAAAAAIAAEEKRREMDAKAARAEQRKAEMLKNKKPTPSKQGNPTLAMLSMMKKQGSQTSLNSSGHSQTSVVPPVRALASTSSQQQQNTAPKHYHHHGGPGASATPILQNAQHRKMAFNPQQGNAAAYHHKTVTATTDKDSGISSTMRSTAPHNESIQSYALTPPVRPIVKPRFPEDNYDISDLHSETETDDEDDPRKQIPSWAKGEKFNAAIIRQETLRINPDQIFAPVRKTVDLTTIFTKQRTRFVNRTSSAYWNSPISLDNSLRSQK